MQIEAYPLIKNALSESEAGKSLQETYRWTTGFRTNETDKEWMQRLGRTGQVFTHLELFYNTVRSFLKHEPGRFTPEKERTFLMGVIPHDYGEAKINGEGIGDISAQVKTSDDEKKESVMARRVISTLNLPEEIKEELLFGYDQVINAKDPELNHAFKAVEKTEYVLTAMRVYENGKKLRAKGENGIKEEQALVGRVLVIDLPKILDVYVPVYPKSIGLLFKNYQGLIDEMFDYSLPWLNEKTEWMGKEINHKELAEKFKIKWEAFKAQA